MAPRVMKLREKEPASSSEVEMPSPSQRKPEVGRFLLQVDRQTKGSYKTFEDAEAAGLRIKKGFPIVKVSIYDSVESTNTLVTPAAEA